MANSKKKKQPRVQARVSNEAYVEQLGLDKDEPSADPPHAEMEPTTGLHFSEAFHASAAARAAITPAEFVRLTFDVTLSVNIVLVAARRIAQFEAEIAQLPVDHALIAQLDTYAYAVGYAQALYSVAGVSQQLQVAYNDALAFRVTLRSDAANLSNHGIVHQDEVLAVKTEVGYRNVGYDLLALVSILRKAGPRAAGRTAILPRDLDRAEKVATQLLELTALKEQRQHGDPRAAEDRLRAITLMVKSYNQARRALHFWRWDYGDADEIAPSIYTARSAKRRGVEVVEEAALPGLPLLPNTAPVASTSNSLESETGLKVPLGAPGGSPFV
jgi:hypothetical protein